MLVRRVCLVVTLPLLCCRSTPTTVRLHVEAGASLATPDELRLSVFGPPGREVDRERVPPCDGCVPELPDDVVLYPAAVHRLRLQLRALQQDGVVGEGVATVDPVAGEQVQATIIIVASLSSRC